MNIPEDFNDEISCGYSQNSLSHSQSYNQYQEINNQLISKGGILNEMSSNLPAYVFSSERKPAQ
jgi:hypothetical protein